MRIRLAIALVITCIPLSASSADKQLRVFIEDHDSYESHSVATGAETTTKQAGSAGAFYSSHSGVRRMNAEEAKTFSKECPAFIVTANLDSANFIIVWDNKESQDTKWGQHENEFTVYSKDGDLIGSGATHRISAAAKDICKILSK